MILSLLLTASSMPPLERPRAVPKSATQTRPARKRSTNDTAFPVRQGVAFRSCAEARAAGVAPLRAGQAGYSRRLDRDGDGVACE